MPVNGPDGLAEMVSILGVLPLAGSGSRLGLAFHKALAPLFVGQRMTHLVEFSIERLGRVCEETVAVTSPEARFAFPAQHFGLKEVVKLNPGELPSSVAVAAQYAIDEGHTHIALSLPDTIWWPEDGFELLVEALDPATDGVLGLFEGDARLLDRVTTRGDRVQAVSLHESEHAMPSRVTGWGCFILRAESARHFTDENPLAMQLATLNLGWRMLSSDYSDLGTPLRYTEAFQRLLDNGEVRS